MRALKSSSGNAQISSLASATGGPTLPPTSTPAKEVLTEIHRDHRNIILYRCCPFAYWWSPERAAEVECDYWVVSHLIKNIKKVRHGKQKNQENQKNQRSQTYEVLRPLPSGLGLLVLLCRWRSPIRQARSRDGLCRLGLGVCPHDRIIEFLKLHEE
jgi:hypothetical protein